MLSLSAFHAQLKDIISDPYFHSVLNLFLARDCDLDYTGNGVGSGGGGGGGVRGVF